MSSRSIEPSNSSIIGSIDTSIKPIIDTTPPNNNTVAIAADTASSLRIKFRFISQPQPCLLQHQKRLVARLKLRLCHLLH